ncbi:MAG: hypothetical protein JXB13_09630 [Phycisphaerae bacterium]|nr:hypothetical protein [Phycisphaerae bacterium]
MRQYETFNILDVAGKAQNYVTQMVDDRHDYLPYWFIAINEAPAWARHVRVDDAELVASWYEAAVCLRRMIGADDRALAVEAGFKKHLLRSWGPQGLRYHEDYPWSNTNHSSFHEMAYILAALNRWLEEEPDNTEVEERASALVRGMRGLVIQRKIRTFWSGDFDIEEPVYEFPGDVYLRDGGFVPERVTGRGEEAVRNGMMLEALVTRAIRHDDEVALDLATGMANHLLGLSHYFNYKGEFFGHVHSAVWVARGLIRLGRHVDEPRYLEKGRQVYEYVKSLSSSFGWVPEYAQWHPPEEEHCETCCIRDMLECALDLIDAGIDAWSLVDRFTRNQLSEQQVKDGCFIAVDNDRPDEDDKTWKNMDRRVVGGWSGGGEPNSVSLSRFRSVAGCCVGTAPQALWAVWNRIVEPLDGGVRVNLPMARDSEAARVEIGYPNAGWLRVTAKIGGDVYVRTFDWMGDRIQTTVDGRDVPRTYADDCLVFRDVAPGAVIMLNHHLDDVVRRETCRGINLTVTWRGSDVVRMDPPGLPLRLYQRELGVPKEYPAPPNSGSGGEVSMAPTTAKT